MDTKVESRIEVASHSRVGIDDLYWLAVPLWEIQEEVKLHGTDCSPANFVDLQKCAEYPVKTILCGCVLEFNSVVDTATQNFRDQIQKR